MKTHCGVLPILHNSPQGLYYECPKCKKGTKGWADIAGAEWEWGGLNTPEWPAGLEELVLQPDHIDFTIPPDGWHGTWLAGWISEDV